MKNVLFPAGVRIEAGPTVVSSRVFDVESGEAISNVRRIEIDLDAESENPFSKVKLHIMPAKFFFIGAAHYVVPEDTLRRLAAENGFDLVPKASGG